MAVQWPVDKLTLINRALVTTGNNLVAAADDGSDEWTVCSPAYEDALAVMLEEHGWGFATKVNAALQPSPTAPTDTQYDTAYPLPADLAHLLWVRLSDTPVSYDVLNGQLALNARGGGSPATVSIKYVSFDNSDPQAGTPLFVRALTMFVMSAIYRGLHEDKDEAARVLGIAEQMSQRARTRHDQQKPKRPFFISRISAARRVRRPCGGTGAPG
jgi:hypothetical protein